MKSPLTVPPKSELLARCTVIHPQLAFDEVLQRGVFADEFPGLDVLLAEAGEENLGCAIAVAILVDVDVAVRSLSDVGIRDVLAFVEQEAAGLGLAVVDGEDGGQFLWLGRGFRDVLAVTNDKQVTRFQAADDGLAVRRKALRDFFLAAREHP